MVSAEVVELQEQLPLVQAQLDGMDTLSAKGFARSGKGFSVRGQTNVARS